MEIVIYRHVANGEILGVSLLMEDALTMGNHDRAVTMEGENGEKLPEDNGSSGLGGRRTSSLSRAPSSRPPSSLDFGRKDKGKSTLKPSCVTPVSFSFHSGIFFDFLLLLLVRLLRILVFAALSPSCQRISDY